MEELLHQIADFKKEYEEEALRLAEELRSQELPELTEELFSEYERNGNRLRYEDVYFGRRKFLSVFGLVCVMRHRAEDLRKLEEILLEICGEECWALPAHVDRRDNPDWRITIDLFASETAQTLSQLVTLLEGELSEMAAETVKREVYRRVLTPFMISRAPYAGWEEGSNNWNAVCCGNIGSAGLFLLKEEGERLALAERIAHALQTGYLEGFGDDGACEEGLEYWVYGVTYYMLFARQLKQVYPDMDLLAGSKAEAIACFQQKCYFSGGRTISFSDGACFGHYPMGLTCSLACRYETVRFPDTAYVRKMGEDPCWRWIGVYWDWYWTGEYLEAVAAGEAEAPGTLPDFGNEFFPDVQWAVFRGAHGSVAAVKGGHNGESHNHKDVGSFFYLADGEAFLDDLGSGEYTKDYFSDKRYTIFCNSGISHNIPLIEGSDQCAGREYRAESFAVPVEGTAVVTFQDAYGVKALKRLERKIQMEEATGELVVTDTAETEGEIDFRENLVTRLPVTVSDGEIVIRGSRLCVKILPGDAAGPAGQRTVLHRNHQGEEEQVHVLQWKVAAREAGRYESVFKILLDES